MNDIYEIRRCKVGEIDLLQTFLHYSWKENHVLAMSKTLLDFQHLDRQEDIYNFIVAYNTEAGKFDALLGFIPTYHFDWQLKNENDFWLTTWKNDTRESRRNDLGLLLFNKIVVSMKPKSIAAIGISEAGEKIYKALRFTIVRLNHYYYINKAIEQFHIALVNSPHFRNEKKKSCKYMIKEINVEDIGPIKHPYRPMKTAEYIINRFVKHPIYKYRLYGVYEKSFLCCVFVVRLINIKLSRCLRVVDIYGPIDGLDNLTPALDTLLQEVKAEYIDILNYGISRHAFESMGFILKVGDDIVIPNHFEPFERRSVDILCAYRTNYQNYVIFKGDGDQDRPNQIN